MSGTIELYSWEGALLGSYKYSCVAHRKRCIDIWRRRYIVGMGRCYLQIRPNPESERTKENGENAGKGRMKSDSFVRNNYGTKNHPLTADRVADPSKADIIYFKRGNTGGSNIKSRH